MSPRESRRSAATLFLSAFIELITVAGARSFGFSIFSPCCFFLISSLSCIFVVILEFLWCEMPGLGVDDMGRPAAVTNRDVKIEKSQIYRFS